MTLARSLSLSRLPARRNFRAQLLAWFDAHARDLPWRRTRDPYAIWVSEIMLQQTRVAAVIERYNIFVARLPTVRALAVASEADVLTLWSGLGYYRRARMMQRAAQVITADHREHLPSTAAALSLLPGIGNYTSAAIASIAFGEAVAVVDGNVNRVVMRLMGWTEIGLAPAAQQIRIQQQAGALLDPARPGDFNQAMMELGATICLPRAPLCLQCPVFDHCLTRGEHPTAPRAAMRSEKIAYALVRRTHSGNQSAEPNEVLLEQRPLTATVMTGMWELPQLRDAAPDPSRVLLTLRHAIMEVNYLVEIAAFTEREIASMPPGLGDRAWFDREQLLALPLTGLARKTLIAVKLFPQAPKITAVASRAPAAILHPTTKSKKHSRRPA